MIIDLPFYKNGEGGKQCFQVCGKTAIKYFLDKDYSLDELDKLTGRKADYWTSTFQIATTLDDIGLKIKYYSIENLEPFLEGEAFYKRRYGKDAEKILKHADISAAAKSIRKLLNSDLFVNRKLSIDDIEGYVESGYVVIVLIDINKIKCKAGFYQGHAVVITGVDEFNVYFHNSGPKNPEANQKVKKNIFIEAMNANGTDNDCIVVFGKKERFEETL